ncbi:MAG: hypothetical protein C4547_07045 [Phycisphaerales bacterium]|nr:MAG: hypothetical protein C4547_07045 [Phycisphaerales bacterium]
MRITSWLSGRWQAAIVPTVVLVSAAYVGGEPKNVAGSGQSAPGAGPQITIDRTFVKEAAARAPGTGPWPHAPQEPQAAPATPPDTAPGRLSVLVHMNPSLALNAQERANVRAFAAASGGFVRYEYTTVLPHVLNLRNIPPASLAALKNMPGVTLVEEDEYIENALALHDSTPLIRGLQSQINAAGLTADGSGVRVCVCDTGIDTDHLMYADRIDLAASYDFNNNDPNPEDDHGHGAHVSGIAVGGTGLSVNFGCVGPEPFQGVAPEATLIGAKVLNQFGGGFSSNIIAGIDHCADQSPNGGRADVINLSIGTGQFAGPCTHSWAVAANNAVANGVVVVAAAGNDAYANALASPACGADVIAVGATYDENFPNCEDPTSSFNWGVCVDVGPSVDDVVCFSNNSDFLDVAAPGCVIYSASIAPGGSTITGMCGTSMSSPATAGLAALILSVDPNLTPAEVRQIIRDGAIDMGAPGFDREYGHGRIDVINSLQLVGPGCTTDPDCDDGLFCNGAETCVNGACQAGTPVNCDDGVACTADSCNEGTNSCEHVPNNGACDDGQFCNGAETCDPNLDCQPGVNPCPQGDVCLEGPDLCCTPVTEICDDGQDNDCDGAVDCADPDCGGDPACACDNDNVCEPGEDCNNCPNDCTSGGGGGVCGNGVCEPSAGEDCLSCPTDCRGKQSGKPSGRYCCGDGAGENPVGCNDGRCNSNGFACSDAPPDPYCCGDDVCEGAEDACNCAIDCDSPPNSETNCTDGLDNDCDGSVDCDDGDCAGDPACACGAKNDPCSVNGDCCSNRCKQGRCR